MPRYRSCTCLLKVGGGIKATYLNKRDGTLYMQTGLLDLGIPLNKSKLVLEKHMVFRTLLCHVTP